MTSATGASGDRLNVLQETLFVETSHHAAAVSVTVDEHPRRLIRNLISEIQVTVLIDDCREGQPVPVDEVEHRITRAAPCNPEEDH